jgi:P27 family predicted phage terminase small subunit
MKGRRPTTQKPANSIIPLGNVPAWYSKEAKDSWKFLCDLRESRGANCTALDRKPLEMACICLSNIRKCQEQLDKEGMCIEGPMGGLMKHPAATTLSQQQTQLRNWLVELGLTPGSIGKMPKDNPIEQRSKFAAI